MINEGGTQLVEFYTNGTSFEWILNSVARAPRGRARVKRNAPKRAGSFVSSCPRGDHGFLNFQSHNFCNLWSTVSVFISPFYLNKKKNKYIFQTNSQQFDSHFDSLQPLMVSPHFQINIDAGVKRGFSILEHRWRWRSHFNLDLRWIIRKTSFKS